MNSIKTKQLLLKILTGYLIMVALIYLISYHQFRWKEIKNEMISANGKTSELAEGQIVSQYISSPAERITGAELRFGTYGRKNSGILTLQLRDTHGNLLAKQNIDISKISDQKITQITFEQPVRYQPHEMVLLSVTAADTANENTVSILTGISSRETKTYTINGTPQEGHLCAVLAGERPSNAWIIYWIFCIGTAVLGIIGVALSWKDAMNGADNILSIVSALCIRYRFLMKQLILRDFKAKYKRSMLGVAWSFLNPLLTMSVQYVVFSTLFRSDIPNYPVYLLTGIVFMNYFSEAISLGMNSITNNGSLIKKVKVPKYSFPIARVVSSLINFGYAMIPLGLMMLVTGTRFHLTVLLLVFDIICLFCFILGMVFLLSTSMTFFQDTQFLWSVLSLLWMYLTPVFYPETIIPAVIRPIYRLNPMYQYITFARTCIIYGKSPSPDTYLACFLLSLLVLTVGIMIFRRNQDKFVLYL